MDFTGLTILAAALAVAAGTIDSESEGYHVDYVQCKDGSLCPDKTTCCQVDTHNYACCPYQSALCCSDHVHCCPLGYNCDVANGTCVHSLGQQLLLATATFEAVTLVPRENRHRGLKAGIVPCPDGNYCQDGQTCCLLASGKYGCCPYAEAVCCSDHASCCPEGYTCRVSTHQCVHASTNHTEAMLKKVDPVVPVPEEAPLKSRVDLVPCPGGTYCEDGATCCLMASGEYGCCPYANAVCCSDHVSCCPEGYTCRVSTHQCLHVSTNHTMAMLKKVDPVVPAPEEAPLKARELSVDNVRCPDGNYCLDGQTCCLLASGRYGCCPYQHAQCCSDHTSCCPEGYRCKVSTHQCLHATTKHILPMLRKVDPIVRVSSQAARTAANVRCPDGNYCLDSQTCCISTSGHYGCCPYRHAECCSDHTSCCPEGYRCKISTRQCLHATTNHSLPMLPKVDPIVRSSDQVVPKHDELSVGNVRCPDGNYCLDGQTCCLSTSGRYGCCPYHHAECCSDHMSCCPEEFRCNMSTHQCLHATTNKSLPMLRKVDRIVRSSERMAPQGKEISVGNVRCPDGNYCLDGQTCCLLTSGRYGCCPYQHAECCSDHASCCPEGYRCKISTHQCLHATTNHSLPMFLKVDPNVRSSERAVTKDNELSVGNVPCPDGNYCLDGQTCCLLTSGRYGCCPYQHAECCSDHSSCCPEGYSCKISTHQCLHATTNHSLPMLRKVDPIVRSSKLVVKGNDITCSDGHKCLSGQTCCQLPSGKYGCCPLPNAVCCEDHKTCCPQGYVCHVSTQTCTFGDHSVPMVRKIPSFQDAALVEAPVSNCPDGSECDDDQTCCEIPDGSYGCCLYNDAVCCDDKVHCCPEGYRCDMQHNQCINKKGHVRAALVNVPARRRMMAAERIPQPAVEKSCPDNSTCPDSMTCCPSGHAFSCCPFSEAQCCDDGEHCCPKGFKCDSEQQACVHMRRPDEAPILKKLPSTPMP